MAQNFVQLKKLFEEGIFVGDCVANYLVVNCANLGPDSPKKVWLKRELRGGQINYTLTFTDPAGTSDEADALSGMWIVQNGKGVMVDATLVDEIIVACEECCDAEPTPITAEYTDEDGVSTFPAITGGTLSSYCITRADDGSIGAQVKFSQDYYGKIASQKVFSASGTSTKYTVTAYEKPAPILTDTIANGVCA